MVQHLERQRKRRKKNASLHREIALDVLCKLGNGKLINIEVQKGEQNDGAKVYYANTVVKDDTDKSELLGLFLKQDAFNNSKFPNLSMAMKYFKEDEKGVSEVAKSMIKEGLSYEVIKNVTHLTEEEIDNLRD